MKVNTYTHNYAILLDQSTTFDTIGCNNYEFNV